MLPEIVQQALDELIIEIKRKRNQEKLQKHIIDPIITYILDKIYPYLVGVSVIFILMLILMFIVLFLVIFDFKFRRKTL